MDPGAFVMLIPLAGLATGVVFMVGIYKLASRWMDRKRLPEGDLADEVDRLRGEVDALRDVALRVDELEERLDFAERLLAQRQPDRLRSES
ncbi:MAG: hypothetical protein IH965_09655 [Gemmatimonadetes bacterium]|nr:hypothetical protein [Gemmatimonadota bacterium]